MRSTLIPFLCLTLVACSGRKELVEQEIDRTSARSSGSSVDALKTPVTFLPSYRDAGGPHLKLDSLNRIIPLDDDLIETICNYHSKQQPREVDSTGHGMRVRYYAPGLVPDELLKEELHPEKAREQAHYKAVFDVHNRLVSLEYVGDQVLATPPANNLKTLYASYWNIVTNQRINYVDENGNRPPPRIKFYTDGAKYVHRIEYINRNREPVATGRYLYGVKHLILEQRIAFPQGGYLTDLHPDLFYRQFDRVEPDWVVKCLYGGRNELTELIIMRDGGTIFYRYCFEHVIFHGQRIVEVRVYNAEKEQVGRYELYFDLAGGLVKKLYISAERQISGYKTYTVDRENMRIAISSYDHAGDLLSRIYREL